MPKPLGSFYLYISISLWFLAGTNTRRVGGKQLGLAEVTYSVQIDVVCLCFSSQLLELHLVFGWIFSCSYSSPKNNTQCLCKNANFIITIFQLCRMVLASVVTITVSLSKGKRKIADDIYDNSGSRHSTALFLFPLSLTLDFNPHFPRSRYGKTVSACCVHGTQPFRLRWTSQRNSIKSTP